MIRFLLALALVLIPVWAQAATITTAKDGRWRDTSTWVGGALPGAADIASISHAIQVDEDLTYAGQTVVNNGGELVVQRKVTLTLNGQQTSTNIIVSSGGTFTHNGIVIWQDGAHGGGAARSGYLANAGSQTNVQGRSLGIGSISSVPLEDATTDSTRVIVDFVERIPNGTTHVRITGGLLPGAIYNLAWSDGSKRGALAGALVLGYGAANQIQTAADDSMTVANTADYDEDSWAGATILQEASPLGGNTTQFAGTVDYSFDSTVETMMIHDLAYEDIAGGSENYILTRGVAPGYTVEYLEMAQFIGNSALPAFDNSVGGNETTGADDTRFIQIDGDLDWDYGALKWMGRGSGSSGAPFYSTTAQTGDWDIKYLQMYQNLAHTHVYFQNATGSGVFSIEDSFFFDGQGPDDGDHGHGIAYAGAGSAPAGTSMTARRVGMWKCDDDFVFSNQAADWVVEDNWAVDLSSGNFFDWGEQETQAGNITVRNNTGFGLGENPLQFDDDGPVTTLTVEGNTWVGCGIALGSNTIDGHEGAGGVANTNGWGIVSSIFNAASHTIQNETVRWASTVGTLQASVTTFPDTLTIRNFDISHHGVVKVRSAATFTANQVAWGAWELQSDVAGPAGWTIIDGGRFYDAFDRATTSTTGGVHVNTRSKVVADVRGGSSSFTASAAFRNIHVDLTDALDQGTVYGSVFCIKSENANTGQINVVGSHFEGPNWFDAQITLANAAVWHFIGNSYIEPSEDTGETVRVRMGSASGTTGINFVRCLFRKESVASTDMVRVLNQGGYNPRTWFTDCIWENTGGTNTFLLQFDSTADANQSTGSANVWDIGTLPLNMTTITGVGTQTTIAALEAAITGWSGTVWHDGPTGGTVNRYEVLYQLD